MASKKNENICADTCNDACALRSEVLEMKELLMQQTKQLQKLLAQHMKNSDPEEVEDSEEGNCGCTVDLENQNLDNIKVDYLYHLGLDTKTHDFPHMFGDVRFIVLGGTPERMEKFAYKIMKDIGFTLHPGASLGNIAEKGNRYAMYKVGPVLSVSHGMGGPSISIVLSELIKLCYYAGCHDPVFMRMGTCGGIGIPPGTVVITEEVFDGQLRNTHEITVNGKTQQLPTQLDRGFAEELKSLSLCKDGFGTIIGKTMCANDFYEGQSRLDGAFCEYSEDDKAKFIKQLKEKEIINIEMESAVFAAYTNRANVSSAILCVTLLDRENGDQIIAKPEEIEQWEERPAVLISRYIRHEIFECDNPEFANSPECNADKMDKKDIKKSACSAEKKETKPKPPCMPDKKEQKPPSKPAEMEAKALCMPDENGEQECSLDKKPQKQKNDCGPEEKEGEGEGEEKSDCCDGECEISE